MRSNCVAVIALSVLVGAVGCKKRVPIAPLPPPAAKAPATNVPAVTPPAPVATATAPTPPPSPLDQANRAFVAGSYDEAARIYEDLLRTTPSGGEGRDEALFRLGLIYASRPAPVDWPRVVDTFKKLIDEYPNSPLKPQANLILSIRAEVDQASLDIKQKDQRIRQLTTELDRLKKIDADRRKRP
jgi:hypothetical protein